MTILGNGFMVIYVLSFFFRYKNAFDAFLKQCQKNYALCLDIGLGAERAFTDHSILDNKSGFFGFPGDYPKMDATGCSFFRQRDGCKVLFA